ncbi:MAG: GntR family transcriptional regulator [Rhizobium sp.]|nr:GntR family transcriptional regulator [Rhizobium sp.]
MKRLSENGEALLPADRAAAAEAWSIPCRPASACRVSRFWPKTTRSAGFTVAKAVEQLVKDGLIVRKQGSGDLCRRGARCGASRAIFLSFPEAVQAAGHVSTHRVLAFRPTEWVAGLPYSEGEPLIFFDRLRYVEGHAVARHSSTLSAELLARIGLTEAVAKAPDFSLYRHFEESGLKVATANERLLARLANEEERRLLDLADDTVVVSVTPPDFRR